MYLVLYYLGYYSIISDFYINMYWKGDIVMSASTCNQYGEIVIKDSVITQIALDVVMQCYGIIGLASKNPANGIFELLKDNMSKGVIIKVNKKGGLEIDLSVVLQYGVKITVVSENIIETVKFNLEKYTGLKVEKINVIVQDIRLHQ